MVSLAKTASNPFHFPLKFIEDNMSPKYRQVQFDAELIEMLKEAKGECKSRKRIRAHDLHKRVVASGDSRMPMACGALRNLWKRHRSKASLYEVEFDTATLPESTPTRRAKPMKTHLPVGDNQAMNSKKSFRVSAWHGGTYGLMILKKFLKSEYDLELFFQYKKVVLLLPNGKYATANITDGFRAGTCCELRCAEIGRWLMEEGYAPWAPEPPPRFFLRHAGGNKFEVTKQTP